ncbi:MAG: hypothetical protein J5955_03875 [Bacilli bacterium]|nr:hypothetical protein [Bacilli bacterium]
MSIITTILTALIVLNNASVTIDDLNFDKREYESGLMRAAYDQNGYCLSFINELESKNNLEDFTNITVLTHGWCSSYKDWLPIDYNSGTNRYVCTNYSLPFVLSGLSNQTNFTEDMNTSVYIFEPGKYSNYDVIARPSSTTLKQLKYEVGDGFSFMNTTSININDINNKNIVLIYNGGEDEENYTIEQCASRFELSLCNVLCQIYNAQFATLGKINLIGHSKGGLVNLLFATRHPKLVNNLISLGTPYEGSSWASILHAIAEMNYVANPTDINRQEVLNYDDLLNPNHALEYSNLFNTLCGDVNSFALGFNTTPFALIYAIIDNNRITSGNLTDFAVSAMLDVITQFPTIFKSYIEEKYGSGPLLEIVTRLVDSFVSSAISISETSIEIAAGIIINALSTLAQSIISLFEGEVRAAKAISDLAKSIADFFGGCSAIDAFNQVATALLRFVCSIKSVINDTFVINTGSYAIINSDVCVDTSSQLGSTYYNFDRRDIITISPFSTNNIYDYYHCSRPALLAVPHNFEAKNPDAISRIVDFLTNNQGLRPFDINTVNIFKVLKMAVFSKDEDHSFIKIGEITPNMFGYPDYYVYEYEIKNDPLNWRRNIMAGDFNITTDVLRTGFIQSEKIVLSPDRSYAGAAFIEFTLDRPAWKIDFDISMWSTKENQVLTDEALFMIDNPYTMDAIKTKTLYQSKACETITSYITENLYYRRDSSALHPEIYRNIVTNSEYEALCGLKNARSISLSSISQDRNSPDNIELIFEKPTKRFGFYAIVKNISERKNNKGRICLGDMTIYG